ncbi:TnpV protein [Anaerococcus sp.]|uniref:TnpV protein n=1 Tax=Anaerococcus TaxID=165779 RepID=UPI00338E0445
MPIKLDLGKLNSIGRARLKFLKENKENSYQIMMMEERLMDHLIDIENQVEEFLTQEERKMMESWGLTLEMKSQDLEKYLKLKKNMDMELQEIAMKEIVLV